MRVRRSGGSNAFERPNFRDVIKFQDSKPSERPDARRNNERSVIKLVFIFISLITSVAGIVDLFICYSIFFL